jgi:hypothetical protein
VEIAMADRRFLRLRRPMIVQPGKARLQSGESAAPDNRPEPRHLALEGDGSRVDARRRYCPQQGFGRQLMQPDLHLNPLVDYPGEDGRKVEQQLQLPDKGSAGAQTPDTMGQGLSR